MWQELSQLPATSCLGVSLLLLRPHPHSFSVSLPGHSQSCAGSVHQLSHGKAGGSRPLASWLFPGAASSVLYSEIHQGRAHPHLLCSLPSLEIPGLCSLPAPTGHAHVVLMIQTFLNFTNILGAGGERPCLPGGARVDPPLPTGVFCLPPRPPRIMHPENSSSTA